MKGIGIDGEKVQVLAGAAFFFFFKMMWQVDLELEDREGNGMVQ